MTALENRIGELCREGRTIYYAVVGRVLYEHPERSAVLAILAKNEAKLPEWDKLRLE